MFRIWLPRAIAVFISFVLLIVALGLIGLLIFTGIAWITSHLILWIILLFGVVVVEASIVAVFESAKDVDRAIDAYFAEWFHRCDKRWLQKHMKGPEKG